jgi:hypothetical protein
MPVAELSRPQSSADDGDYIAQPTIGSSQKLAGLMFRPIRVICVICG